MPFRLDQIERAIRSHEPHVVSLDGAPARAAVAIVIDSAPEDDLHLFFIHRAVDERDPWSGHMGFPGGFMEDADGDLVATVSREVLEETGIDLRRSARLLGRLDEIQGVARGRQLPLVISPFLFALNEPVVPEPNEEVQGVLWVPLGFLADPRNEQLTDHQVATQRLRLPGFVYEQRIIWGLTFRMVQNFLSVIGARATSEDR